MPSGARWLVTGPPGRESLRAEPEDLCGLPGALRQPGGLRRLPVVRRLEGRDRRVSAAAAAPLLLRDSVADCNAALQHAARAANAALRPCWSCRGSIGGQECSLLELTERAGPDRLQCP